MIANNPGPFTFTGTGTYIVGRAGVGAGVAVIDPGPLDEAHLAALLRAVEGQTVSHVLVTHTHRDHAPLARPFAAAVGAPILAAPPARTVHVAASLDEEDDETFSPDIVLTGGERLAGDGWTIEAMATPGHASNHLAFVLLEENALFSGDHVMGWSTTIVAPPDGDMVAYMASLDAVMARDFSTLWPTHGAPITEPGSVSGRLPGAPSGPRGAGPGPAGSGGPADRRHGSGPLCGSGFTAVAGGQPVGLGPSDRAGTGRDRTGDAGADPGCRLGTGLNLNRRRAGFR